jgi:hypothetical protein
LRGARLAIAGALLAAAHVAGCGKKAPLAGDAATSEGAQDAAPAAGEAMSEREAAQWEAAKGGEPEERIRLADLVGCEALEQRAEVVELRPIALAAMAYCPDLSELPWLARVAKEGSAGDARMALEAVVDQAARARRSTDPEDAEELHAGCQALLALARDVAAPKERRALAVSALRMLSERGCVKREEIPADLDAR